MHVALNHLKHLSAIVLYLRQIQQLVDWTGYQCQWRAKFMAHISKEGELCIRHILDLSIQPFQLFIIM